MSLEAAQESIDAIRAEIEQIKIGMKHVSGRYRENIMDSLRKVEKFCDVTQREMWATPYVMGDAVFARNSKQATQVTVRGELFNADTLEKVLPEWIQSKLY